MPKPYPLRLVVKVLESKGFFFVAQTGAHAKYRKAGNPMLTVIVPIHGNEVQHGTFRSILRQSNLTKDDFEEK
ncbi:type II toxin-antitoxin system HicA family toxin [Candidatus Falkowbacteria bacterium]|nr:type II toxin-antitoxin system HicA family toxin [Candidatus Falkowbacteria bacterium]